MTIYEIPGARVHMLEDFWVVIGEVVNGQGGYFGRNLDAFNDCLRGDYGTPEIYGFRWRDHRESATHLGYDETVRQLKKRLATCHRSHRPNVRRQLRMAQRGEGPTVFDWLVEIIRDNQVPLELA